MRLRRIIWAYQDFMRRKKLAKYLPELEALSRRISEAQKHHRPCRKDMQRRRAIMNGLLEG